MFRVLLKSSYNARSIFYPPTTQILLIFQKYTLLKCFIISALLNVNMHYIKFIWVLDKTSLRTKNDAREDNGSDPTKAKPPAPLLFIGPHSRAKILRRSLKHWNTWTKRKEHKSLDCADTKDNGNNINLWIHIIYNILTNNKSSHYFWLNNMNT